MKLEIKGVGFSYGSRPALENIIMSVITDSPFTVFTEKIDQIGTKRPVDILADIGAVEMP